MPASTPQENLPVDGTSARNAAIGICAIIDVETTGLDPDKDEIIELGVLLFEFDGSTGEIQRVVDEYSGLREPTCPIKREASRKHRLTRSKLRGKSIDVDKATELLKKADIFISHNARFDSDFLSRFMRVPARPWLCSMNGIPWKKHGHTSKALEALLQAHGLAQRQAHRALADCRAILGLLSSPCPRGYTYLRQLLPKHERPVSSRSSQLSGSRREVSTEEKDIIEVLAEIVGDRTIGYHKSSSGVYIGPGEDGDYWFARLYYGPRSKYIVLNTQDKPKIPFKAREDLIESAHLIRAAYAKSLEWKETAERYAREGPRELVVHISIDDLLQEARTRQTADRSSRSPTTRKAGCLGSVVTAFLLLALAITLFRV
jgi:DNA polymerase-3 subunit epsilon